jgi:hypothetical protein
MRLSAAIQCIEYAACQVALHYVATLAIVQCAAMQLAPDAQQHTVAARDVFKEAVHAVCGGGLLFVLAAGPAVGGAHH